MTKKKMGSMSSLSKLSGIKSKRTSHDTEEASVSVSSPAETTEIIKPEPEIKPTETTTTETQAKVVNKKTSRKKKQGKLVTVNIKIRKDQKDWLTDTASQVRDNNTDPVPPAERVYPQHLIGVAIDLLQNADVDWGEIKNVEELRKLLNL